MRLLLTAATCLGFSCIMSAQAFAGTGIIFRPSDFAASMRTSLTVDDGIVGDRFGANILNHGATRDPKDDSQQDARIAGTFVGNPN